MRHTHIEVKRQIEPHIFLPSYFIDKALAILPSSSLFLVHNVSDEMIHNDELLNHLIVFLKKLFRKYSTHFKNLFAWENLCANLNTLK